MATPPDFSPGQVLTAAHMDAVGLWLVKSQTIGSAVSSVTVTDAFTADFTNYRVVVSAGITSAANVHLNVQLRTGSTTSTASYYSQFFYNIYAGGTATANVNNGTSWQYVVTAMGTGGWCGTFDVLNPRVAAATGFNGTNARADLGGMVSGFHNVATAYESLVFTISAGTMTGGTIRVYGYRN